MQKYNFFFNYKETRLKYHFRGEDTGFHVPAFSTLLAEAVHIAVDPVGAVADVDVAIVRVDVDAVGVAEDGAI